MEGIAGQLRHMSARSSRLELLPARRVGQSVEMDFDASPLSRHRYEHNELDVAARYIFRGRP